MKKPAANATPRRQTKPETAPTPEKVAQAGRANALLIQMYGKKRWQTHHDPLSELVLTILSQHTSDINSGRAFAQLRQRFPSWETVRDATVEEVAAAIQPGGLAGVKAPRIQRVLSLLSEQRPGELLSLDYLHDQTVPEIRSHLAGLPGVGPKTVACVLLFSLGRQAMPVDTHVYRVTRRLGLIGPRVSADAAHVLLEALLPADQLYTFHLNLIAHGRTLCRPQRPLCEACLLRPECCYYAEAVQPRKEASDA